MLQAAEISKVRNNTAVLRKVSVVLEPGKVTGVLSLDKSETSALLDILAGLDQADSGKITLNQQVLTEDRQGWGDQGIQLVPGSGRLFPNLSILDNLLVGMSSKKKVVHQDRMIHAVRPTIEYFGLKRSLDTPVAQLSVAERRLLAVILFFMQEANYLLMRDCLTSVSLEQYKKFQEKLKDLKENGKGILLVPEAPAQLFELCDDVVLLRRGRVIYSGSVSEIDIEEAHNILNNSEYMIRQAIENKFNQFHNNITRPEILFERSLKVVGNFCGLPNAFILFHDENGESAVRFSKYWNKATKYGLEKNASKILSALPFEKRLGVLNLAEDKFLWYALSATAGQLVILAVEAAEHPGFPFREIRKEMASTLAALREKLLQEKLARELELKSFRLAQEMDIARNIQSSILPKNPVLPGYEIAAHMETASEVGGDSYDVLNTPLGNFISIGDVSGHGLPSGIMALIEMSALHGIIQSHLAFGSPPQPDKIYDMVNRVLCEINRDRIGSDKFMTKLLLIENEGRFFHAGTHEIGLYYDSKQDAILELAEMIDQTAFLGLSELVDSSTSLGSFTMAEGDFLLLYTDGLIEAKDARSEQFGLERTKQWLKQNCHQAPESILTSLRDELYRFAQDGDVRLHQGHLADDLTMLLIKRKHA